jgi:hypothetical protein
VLPTHPEYLDAYADVETVWKVGHGRIAVLPSVNVGYNDDESRGVKKRVGYATEIIHRVEDEMQLQKYDKIKWDPDPPKLIKCEPDWTHPAWIPFQDQAEDQQPFDWTHSGYFSADQPIEGGITFEDGGGKDI